MKYVIFPFRVILSWTPDNIHVFGVRWFPQVSKVVG
jgi:hypothetical protein